MTLQLSLIVTPTRGYTYDDLRAIAHAVEDAGMSTLWIADHFFGGEGFPDRNCLEAWTLIAALARDTTRLRLGTMVTAQSYRNPALLAKTVASVDHISGGRIEFGVGAGWKENEYRAYGYDFPRAGVRVDQLRETLEICRRMWAEERATYRGRHYRIVDAVCAPKPAQRPHPPITIGGGKPRVMRLAARYADAFNLDHRGGTPTPDDWQDARQALAEACREVGRDPGALRLSHWNEAEIGTPEASGEAAGKLSGGPDALLAALGGYAAAGVAEVQLSLPYGRELEMVRILASDVVPRLS
ncbi:MAG: TIGR03560 family F420-dependent LLM class oxidoreductase [Candidatus Limnocylindria bacterium]